MSERSGQPMGAADQQGPADWTDDPVLRALRAPATPEELATETEYLTMFRAVSTLPAAEVRPSRPLRRIGRLGVGTATVMATVVLTGGVAAAAYTRTLPGPVQEIAHGMLGPIGVPAPPAPRREAAPVTARVPAPTIATPRAEPTHRPGKSHSPKLRDEPGASPTRPAHPDHSPSAGPAIVPDTVAPSPTEDITQPTPTTSTPSPTEPTEPTEPTTTPPLPPPPTITSTVSSTRVPWQESVVVTGRVTADDGSPLRRRPVALLGRKAGDPGWQVLARARTDRTGTVRLTTTVEATTRLVLRSGRGVRSPKVRVVMIPSISAWATGMSPTPGTHIRILASGAQSGDTVTLFRRQRGQLVTVATTTVDGQGRALIDLPTTIDKGLRVRLDRTPRHAAVRAPVVSRTTTP